MKELIKENGIPDFRQINTKSPENKLIKEGTLKQCDIFDVTPGGKKAPFCLSTTQEIQIGHTVQVGQKLYYETVKEAGEKQVLL